MLTVEQAAADLVARYTDATDAQRARGREWYSAARRECRAAARQYGFTFRRAAAVLAITSPDAQLVQNVAHTRRALELMGIGRHGRYPAANAPKVWRALFTRRPSDHVRGPKVEPFYRAICGDRDVLVIDRWASFAAGGPRDEVPRAADRRVIADAYRLAAAHCGESLRDFQAIVWIQCRESTPDARGVVRQYTDITSRQEV